MQKLAGWLDHRTAGFHDRDFELSFKTPLRILFLALRQIQLHLNEHKNILFYFLGSIGLLTHQKAAMPISSVKVKSPGEDECGVCFCQSMNLSGSSGSVFHFFLSGFFLTSSADLGCVSPEGWQQMKKKSVLILITARVRVAEGVPPGGVFACSTVFYWHVKGSCIPKRISLFLDDAS